MAAAALALGGAAAAAAGLLPWPRAVLALLLYAMVACVVRVGAAAAGERAFGLAHRLTLARAVIACPIAALAGATLAPAVTWAVIGGGGMALALDALDGRVARARHEASRFGDRFDLEADAFLALALALVVLPKAGPVALGIGLMRYAFLAASAWVPRLRAPLAPNSRRRAIGALQGPALLAALLPPVPPGAATVLVLAAALPLAVSFALDTRHLLRQGRPG